MPVYKRRFLKNYPHEFWRCAANPEGYGYPCVFCCEFFKTKYQQMSHMEECAEEHTGEEYDEEYMIDDDLTVGDINRDNEIYESTIKNFIRSNELEALSNQQGEFIERYIKRKLFENGMSLIEDHKVFKIYEFFFEVTEAEKDAAHEKWVERIMEKFDFE